MGAAATKEKQAAERVTIYTTAPAAYDGFSTREESADCGRDNSGRIVRRVAMDGRDYTWQTMRYASGSHMAMSPPEWVEMIAAGVFTESPSESPPLPADPIAAAAIELFHSVECVNRGVWQVPHAAMRKLMQAVQAAGHSF